MAVEIQTVQWCDRHLVDKDEREPGETWVVQFKGPGRKTQTLVVEACPSCATVLADAAEFVDTYGRKPGKAAKAPKRTEPEPVAEPEPGTERLVYPCPECGKGCASAQGMGSHRWRAHGVRGTSKDAERKRAAAE